MKELNGDSRRGYEISAWSSGSMSAKQALNQWTGSQVRIQFLRHFMLKIGTFQAHFDVMMTQGIWGQVKLTDFGCYWKGNFAHCWFTNDQKWYN